MTWPQRKVDVYLLWSEVLAELINELIPQLLLYLQYSVSLRHGCHGYFCFPKGMNISWERSFCLQGFFIFFSFRMFSGFYITVRNLSGLNCFSARFLWNSRNMCFHLCWPVWMITDLICSPVAASAEHSCGYCATASLLCPPNDVLI